MKNTQKKTVKAFADGILQSAGLGLDGQPIDRPGRVEQTQFETLARKARVDPEEVSAPAD